MTSSCTSSSSSNFLPAKCFFRWGNKCKSLGARYGLCGGWSDVSHVHLLRWEIVWRDAPRVWRVFGSALQFQTRLTQTKPFLPLSNEHGSQVKDQGRRQFFHNKHKKFPYRSTRDVSLLSEHTAYIDFLMRNLVLRHIVVLSCVSQSVHSMAPALAHITC
jgi:hypothetical protein